MDTDWIIQFSKSNTTLPIIKALVPVVTQRQTWIDAGIPVDVILDEHAWDNNINKTRLIANLAYGCLGPTLKSLGMILIVFCCDTGWNKQPMLDLPRNPYLYRTMSKVGLTDSAFVASFKRRAKHEVLAYLERESNLAGMAEEAVTGTWKETVRNADPQGKGDGYSLLNADASLIGMLDRFQRLSNVARPFDINDKFDEKFFFYLSRDCGLTNQNIHLSGYTNKINLERKGVNFRTIRKTMLSLKVRQVESVSATVVFAGHKDSSVLLRHYLTSSELKAEMDLSIRFFQSSIQSLITPNGEKYALRIDMKVDDFVWFRRLADVASISAACGVAPLDHSLFGPENVLCFHPTESNLIDLYLAHRALRRARLYVPATRWKVQALPLLACVKAIGRALFQRGLGQAYTKSAYRAAHLLSEGKITLPVVM